MEYNIQSYASVSSTQDIAMEILDSRSEKDISEKHDVLVIHAMSQNKGRGRHGNIWHAPMGNLYLSLILSPNIEAKNCGQLSFMSALAVHETVLTLLQDEADIDIQLKWPNDVLVNGQKIAGILIESYKDSYILGVGLNILSPPENAIGIQSLSSKRNPINAVRDLFLDIFDAYYIRWQKQGFEPIRDKWMRHAIKLNEEIKVKLAGQTLEGIFEGIDSDGALLLRQKGGIQKILSGDVYFQV